MPLNAERYLKSADAMRRLFPDRPDAIKNAARLAERLAPPLDATVRHLPRYPKLPTRRVRLLVPVRAGLAGKQRQVSERLPRGDAAAGVRTRSHP